MALQLRRGQNAQRTTTLLAQGELVYVTDNASAQVSPLFVGDGSTTGGIPVVRVVSVNGQIGAIFLDSDDLTEGTTNKYYTTERAQDDVASMLMAGTHTGISFTYNPTPQDQGNRIDAVVSASGTVNTGFTHQLAFYNQAGTAVNGAGVQNTHELGWDNSTGTLELLAGSTGGITVVASGTQRAIASFESNTIAAAGHSVDLKRSRGSFSAKTVVANNDIISTLNFSAYDGLNFLPTAKIAAYISGPVSLGIAPSVIGMFTTDANGLQTQPFRVLSDGSVAVGPFNDTESGTGRIQIVSTYNPSLGSGSAFGDSALSIKTIFNGADGQNISISRARGTPTARVALSSGDDIADMMFTGWNGTDYDIVGQITCTIDGAYSGGNLPGELKFGVRSTGTGNITYVTRIRADGTLLHNGNIATTKTPGTFWNYDSSASTVTMTLGQTLVFGSFSGSILVNCHNSGTVTQYLCGGTSTSAFSSTSPNTGTMAYTSGVSGYTFTSTEAGVHSFYVVRTRAAA